MKKICESKHHINIRQKIGKPFYKGFIVYYNIMDYYLYVIELDKKVGKLVKYRKQNPKLIFGSLLCGAISKSSHASI